MKMIFIQQQIKQIRSGGLLALRRKMRGFPGWFLWWFVTSKYGVRAAYYGSRIGVLLMPRWAGVHVLLARVLISMGRFDEAFTVWERAFRLKPDWPGVYNRVQNAFFFCGQTYAARNVMQRILNARNDFAREHQLDKMGMRFLCEWTHAIGHLALLDSYVKMDKLGWRSKDRPVLLVQQVVANPCYLEYWRRYLPDMITDPLTLKLVSPFAKYLEDPIFVVKDSSGRQNMGQDYGGAVLHASIQAQWDIEGRSPLLILSEVDHERGWQCLRRLGVPADAWFVSLHVREGQTESRGARDADIAAYRMAIESIVKRGGWVIRMGDPYMTPLPPMPQVIDYAHSQDRCDWMDVFLWARCRFFIGTQSGPAWVPPTFGIPCVATNWTLFSRRWYKQDLCIPKLVWSEKENRYLPFAEVLASGIGDVESVKYLDSKGIRIVNNTAEEINDVVIEMIDRLEGNLIYSDRDNELQKHFDIVWPGNPYKINARIGREFLIKWEQLL